MSSLTAPYQQTGVLSWIGDVVAVLSRHVRQARAVLRHRRDARRLAMLDDRMLADIGITRSDVNDAFSSPLWEDPTVVLRARALERRLSRHHVSHGFVSEAPPLSPAEGFKQPPTDRPARFTV